MLDSFVQQKVRELVEMATEAGGRNMNLRVAWATLGLVHGDERWSAETRRELDGINTAFEEYIGKTELAKFGQQAPPPDQEFDALMGRIRALERLLPAGASGAAPA